MRMKQCSMWLAIYLLGFGCHSTCYETNRNGLNRNVREHKVCALVSQVGFRDYKAVLKTKVEERMNAIVNRLNGTKRDVPHPDLAGEREAYEKEVRGLLSHSDLHASAARPCHGSFKTDPQCRLKGVHGKDEALIRSMHSQINPVCVCVCVCEQVRQAKKAEVQAQKKAEKAAREAAEREKDSRSYKNIMQVREGLSYADFLLYPSFVHHVLQTMVACKPAGLISMQSLM